MNCDSIYNIIVNVEMIDNNITQTNDSLFSILDAEDYQWIDCHENDIIEGETSIHFAPQVSGSYAIEIIKNGCYDLSPCFEYIITSTEDINSLITIYPNPTTGKFYLQNNESNRPLHIVISNNLGQIVYNHLDITSDEVSIDLVKKGVYFVAVYSESKLVGNRVVIAQ